MCMREWKKFVHIWIWTYRNTLASSVLLRRCWNHWNPITAYWDNRWRNRCWMRKTIWEKSASICWRTVWIKPRSVSYSSLFSLRGRKREESRWRSMRSICAVCTPTWELRRKTQQMTWTNWFWPTTLLFYLLFTDSLSPSPMITWRNTNLASIHSTVFV